MMHRQIKLKMRKPIIQYVKIWMCKEMSTLFYFSSFLFWHKFILSTKADLGEGTYPTTTGPIAKVLRAGPINNNNNNNRLVTCWLRLENLRVYSFLSHAWDWNCFLLYVWVKKKI
jgi:hypothetical protein